MDPSSEQPPNPSRRNFIKIGALGAAAGFVGVHPLDALAQASDEKVVPAETVDARVNIADLATEHTYQPPDYIQNPRKYFSVTESQTEVSETHLPDAEIRRQLSTQEMPAYSGAVLEYSGRAKDIIDGLLRDFGVKVLSPAQWPLGDGTYINTIPWTDGQLHTIALGFSQLPQSYQQPNEAGRRSYPKELWAIRMPGTFGSAGGGYNGGTMLAFLPDEFVPQLQLKDFAGKAYGTNADVLRSLPFHECTHIRNEIDPRGYNRFLTLNGWYQEEDGTWKNSRPENLINSASADQVPWEDLAVTVSVTDFHPEVLDFNRKHFLYTDPDYGMNWAAVQSHEEALKPASQVVLPTVGR